MTNNQLLKKIYSEQPKSGKIKLMEALVTRARKDWNKLSDADKILVVSIETKIKNYYNK